jgi:hypothetical protein
MSCPFGVKSHGPSRRGGSRRVVVACLAYCLLGCGRATGLATHPVSGTVTLDGKPRVVSPGLPPVFKLLVPARYNQSTTLTAEVTATGTNRFDFELTSD